MASILVTGATGFVGSHVLEALATREDVTVIAACRDPSRLLPDFKGEVRQGDLRDDAYLDRVLDGVDVVCHCAAWTSLWGHADASRRLYREPSLKLIDRAIEKGVKRFINTSTTSAAAPSHSTDANSRGIPRKFWPHLCNVIVIEDYMRDRRHEGMSMVNLRLGIFTGRRYALGILPILLPRLKTHMVPWVAGGKTSLPMISGQDIGQAFALSAVAEGLDTYEAFNIVGPTIPTVREVIEFIHHEFGYSKPHFGVPFVLAYPFAWLMEKLDPIVPWEPLVSRSIIHLLEEVNVDNQRAKSLLAYQPKVNWQDAVREQIQEMSAKQTRPMSMARPVIE